LVQFPAQPDWLKPAAFNLDEVLRTLEEASGSKNR
jgi:hypothetical protein